MFKVGDKVKVVKTGRVHWHDGSMSGRDWCEQVYKDVGLTYPKDIATISHVNSNGNIRIEGYAMNIPSEHFCLVSSNKKKDFINKFTTH